MFPTRCSIYLNHHTGLLSVSIPPFIHPCTQSGGQTAVQPAQALSQSRWVVQTNHCCSRMLWPASVPAALTPRYLSVLSQSLAFLLVLFFPWCFVLRLNESAKSDDAKQNTVDLSLIATVCTSWPAELMEIFALRAPPHNTLKLCVCFHRDSQALPRILDGQALSCSVAAVCDSSFRTHQIWFWNMLLA